MRHHAKFTQFQDRVEYFDAVCQFLSIPRCTIILLVLWQLKRCVEYQSLIWTSKHSNTYMLLIFVTPLWVFRCEAKNCTREPPHLDWRSGFSWCVGTHQAIVPWRVGVRLDVDICTWGWGGASNTDIFLGQGLIWKTCRRTCCYCSHPIYLHGRYVGMLWLSHLCFFCMEIFKMSRENIEDSYKFLKHEPKRGKTNNKKDFLCS